LVIPYDDPFNLSRFVEAQVRSYDTALAEILAGRKRSHWMWYVFPQFDGLGSSATSKLYSIKSGDEAKAYLTHPVLGPRLLEITRAVFNIEGLSAHDIFGSPDDAKLHSCATLFALMSTSNSVFHRILDKYYQGEPDSRTLDLINGA